MRVAATSQLCPRHLKALPRVGMQLGDSGQGGLAMTYPSGIVRLMKDRHRLHERTFILSAVCASISTAFALKVTAGQLPKFEVIGFMCNQFDRCVVFPFAGPIEQMLTNTIPDVFEFRIDEQPRGRNRQSGEWPMEAMFTKVIAPFFVEFYEDFGPWIRTHVHTEFIKWPPVWQFARIVRNAASHGGRVGTGNPAFLPVTWHGLTYGPAQDGHKLFGADLALADILLLMLEMNDSLDQLGCPIEP
jgi:hypothetical protein